MEDAASKLYKTRLSFPSDFTTRANELKDGKKSEHSKYRPQMGMLRPKRQNSESKNDIKRHLGRTKNQTSHREGSRIGSVSNKRSASNHSDKLLKSKRIHHNSKQKRLIRLFQNLPNKGMHVDRVNQKEDFLQERQKQREQNRRKAEEEALRLMKVKSDMFERYLRKPRNSSIGFLALSNAEKKGEKHQQQINLNNTKR